MLKIVLTGDDVKKNVILKKYSISTPYNQIEKIQDKKIYFTVSNVKHLNVKGEYYIYYCRKISLNDDNFVQKTNVKVKSGPGWITNTSKVTENQSFKPILNEFVSSFDEPVVLSKDILNVSQYVMLSKKFLIYIPNANYKTKLKERFPFELLKDFQKIHDNYHFFVEYADRNNEFFKTEEIEINFNLYDEY